MFTDGYGGKRVVKTIIVYCNDPRRQQFSLVMIGEVKRFAAIEPGFARLFGKAGDPIHTTIRIVPDKPYRFRILGPVEQETDNIRFTLSRLDTPDGQGYLLTVRNVRKKTGRYYERIVLKTDSPVKPEIKISVYGHISE